MGSPNPSPRADLAVMRTAHRVALDRNFCIGISWSRSAGWKWSKIEEVGTAVAAAEPVGHTYAYSDDEASGGPTRVPPERMIGGRPELISWQRSAATSLVLGPRRLAAAELRISAMLKAPRQLGADEIEQLLARDVPAHLAMLDVEGFPHRPDSGSRRLTKLTRLRGVAVLAPA
jgi:hypothetical protein